MLKEIKYCQRCGAIISELETADYYAHIRLKYCKPCSKAVKQEQTNESLRRLRMKKKARDKARDEQLELLKQENELLRQNIIKLREFAER